MIRRGSMAVPPGRRGSENGLETLTRQVRDSRLLSAAEEIRLAKRIEGGDPSAKEQMIESNLRLVFAIARSFRGCGVPFADLVQEGSVGLVGAVERFDHRRGLRFSTFASWWIRRSILDAIAGSRVIRIPPKANRQLVAVRRAETELERLGLRRASNAAISQRTGLGTQTVGSLRGAARVTASLDQPVGDHAIPLGDLVADESAVDPCASAIACEDRREVSAMLRLLPARHREVLVRRYGLDRCAQSHREIGLWLGVGEERSRQIEREALHRLRAIARPSPRAA